MFFVCICNFHSTTVSRYLISYLNPNSWHRPESFFILTSGFFCFLSKTSYHTGWRCIYCVTPCPYSFSNWAFSVGHLPYCCLSDMFSEVIVVFQLYFKLNELSLLFNYATFHPNQNSSPPLRSYYNYILPSFNLQTNCLHCFHICSLLSLALSISTC